MNRIFKRIVLIALSAVILLTAFGCSAKKAEPETEAPVDEQTPPAETTPAPEVSPEPEAPETDYTEVYSGLVNNFYSLIQNGGGDYEAGEGEVGVLEAAMGMGSGAALDGIGYAVKDLSGDGIPELLIGAVDERDGSIYAAYTCAESAPQLVFEGMSRSGYRYIGDGKFLYQGSGGAIYSIFGVYALSQDGRSLTCEDLYFTYEKDETFEEIGFYHNTSGDFDKAVSEELEISDEEFWQIESALAERVLSLEMTPFSVFAPEAPAAEPQVSIQFAEDALGGYSDYDEFTADESDVQTRVMFTAESGAADFKVLALTLEDAGESGEINFSTQELYALDELTPERPLVVGMTFFGTIPSYGISYVDAGGALKRFAVGMSGEDGSLLLIEF